MLLVFIQADSRRLRKVVKSRKFDGVSGTNVSVLIKDSFLGSIQGLEIDLNNHHVYGQLGFSIAAHSIKLPSIQLARDESQTKLILTATNTVVHASLNNYKVFIFIESISFVVFLHSKLNVENIYFNKFSVYEDGGGRITNTPVLNDIGNFAYGVLSLTKVKNKILNEMNSLISTKSLQYSEESLKVHFVGEIEFIDLKQNYLALNFQLFTYGFENYEKRYNYFEPYSNKIYSWKSYDAIIPNQIIGADLVIVLDESVLSFAILTFSLISKEITITCRKGIKMVTITPNQVLLKFNVKLNDFTQEVDAAFSFSVHNGEIQLSFNESDNELWNFLQSLATSVPKIQEKIKTILEKYSKFVSTEYFTLMVQKYANKYEVRDFKIVQGEGVIFIAAQFN